MPYKSVDVDDFQVRQALLALLAEHEVVLSQDAYDAILHYIQHDEYEIALEGLCIQRYAQQ